MKICVPFPRFDIMIKIAFPDHPFKIKEEGGNELIWDEFRKKWLVITPEEWVRQNILQYMVQVKKYPAALIALERELLIGEVKKRFDIVVYNGQHQPWLMVECKAMHVPVNERVLQQIIQYNMALPVTYMMVTNGNNTFCCKNENGRVEWLEELPEF